MANVLKEQKKQQVLALGRLGGRCDAFQQETGILYGGSSRSWRLEILPSRSCLKLQLSIQSKSHWATREEVSE